MRPRAGIDCEVYAPATASPGKLVQAAAYGAKVDQSRGQPRRCRSRRRKRAAETPGNAYASHNWHPFFIEGVKTWAYEVWEQLGFQVPDVVVAPRERQRAPRRPAAFSSLLKWRDRAIRDLRRAAGRVRSGGFRARIMATTETTPFTRTATLAEGT